MRTKYLDIYFSKYRTDPLYILLGIKVEPYPLVIGSKGTWKELSVSIGLISFAIKIAFKYGHINSDSRFFN